MTFCEGRRKSMKLPFLERFNEELCLENAPHTLKHRLVKTLFVNLVSLPLADLRDRIYASYLAAKINWLELSPTKKLPVNGRIAAYNISFEAAIRRVRSRRNAGWRYC
jgi:hypothetical protein